MEYSLENEFIKLTFDSFGAELTSIINLDNNKEYLWNAGDAWKRHSPVLFPIVGGLKNKQFTYEGKEYPMGQHGFARDTEFIVAEQTNDSITFMLTESPDSLEKFPFYFQLFITYTLNGNSFEVKWEVSNTNDTTFHFSIGGHPAFVCPLNDEKQTDCYLHFDEDKLDYYLLSENGLFLDDTYKLHTDGGFVKITEDFFNKDALILYNNRLRKVSLAGSNKKDYLTVEFDAPVYGIWSAKGKHAPFVCIEPWYGRADAESFVGDWNDREFDNSLEPGETFSGAYTVTVL